MVMKLVHPKHEECPDSERVLYYDPPVIDGVKAESPVVCGGCSEQFKEEQ